MSRRVIVSMFALLFVVALASFASAQGVEAEAVVADETAVIVAPCGSCGVPCYNACCNPCRPRFIVDDGCCGPVVYRRGLFGCYRPVHVAPACYDPCCPPAPRFYRGWQRNCCW